MIESYMTVKETAEKWGLTVRTVQMMCTNNKIAGVVKFGRAWVIPTDVERPVDGRVITGQYKNWRKKYRVTESVFIDVYN